MPVATFVHSTPDADCEQFFIDNADVGNHHGHFTWSLTEAQFRDQFKSRGVSEQEIDDLLARARQGVPPVEPLGRTTLRRAGGGGSRLDNPAQRQAVDDPWMIGDVVFLAAERTNVRATPPPPDWYPSHTPPKV
jgi:hypothetical protein